MSPKFGNDVNHNNFDTYDVYLLSISSEGTVSDVCGPVSNGSVGAGISLIKVWKSVQETSANLFRVVSGEIGYIYMRI